MSICCGDFLCAIWRFNCVVVTVLHIIVVFIVIVVVIIVVAAVVTLTVVRYLLKTHLTVFNLCH